MFELPTNLSTAAAGYFDGHPESEIYHSAATAPRTAALRQGYWEVCCRLQVIDLSDWRQVGAVCEQALHHLKRQNAGQSADVVKESIDGLGSCEYRERTNPYFPESVEALIRSVEYDRAGQFSRG